MNPNDPGLQALRIKRLLEVFVNSAEPMVFVRIGEQLMLMPVMSSDERPGVVSSPSGC